ncbi:pectate lyase [Prosthecobacter fusiformis]|uniref:Pectate lyase n=1 Tax=Prosthecobacter fusiformis TaxID=48464 RepID=A0A4R7S0L9_9BACT|nr:hypothetical protein [Prosthecobacter fusiformis]TDU70996.1 pectate lyase [Prosthecobacter fusiformis]
MSHPLLSFIAAFSLLCGTVTARELAFDGATGFGAYAQGGKGGHILEVTRLDDDVKSPQPGMLRWALTQKGPRIIKFRVGGTILLHDTLEVKEPFLTMNGQDAPGQGICIRGGTLDFEDTHDIILRYFRVRLGDETTQRRNKEQGVKRPKNSSGLDCISLTRCRDVIVDHVSTSWCCDELFSVVHCQGITVQWCLLAEPLTNPALHPYGDNHAFCFNSSANTLSVYHCLFAHYVMRGPQFEANDMRREDTYDVQMEAVNNVMFDYQKSGSRYTTGVEDHRDETEGKNYAFQFIGNVYLGDPKRPAIEAVMKHDVHPGVKAFVDDARHVKLSDTKGREEKMESARQQLSTKTLFTSPIPIKPLAPDAVLKEVLDHAGCSHARDSVDQRIVTEVRNKKFGITLRSQADVGGWPILKGE